MSGRQADVDALAALLHHQGGPVTTDDFKLTPASCSLCTVSLRQAERLIAAGWSRPAGGVDGNLTDAERTLLAACGWFGSDAALLAAVTSIKAAAVEQARADERQRIADAIAGSVPYGFGMRPDGTEDPLASAYTVGLHDAHSIALADPEAGEDRG